MRVIDPGHKYELAVLDGNVPEILTHVKRVGDKYPGNLVAYSGTTTQEVIRAEIDRLQYVNAQIPFWENERAIELLRYVLFALESRAKRAIGQTLRDVDVEVIELIPTCPKCLHIKCIKH